MKKKPSKLDPFVERLEAWNDEGKTIAQIREQLASDGCKISTGRLSEYLEALRRVHAQDHMLTLIGSGGRMLKDLDKAYEKHPAPEIDQMMRVSKTLIMSLQVHGAANPELLALANSMQKTVLDYLSGKTRAELEFKKLALAREKFETETCEKLLDEALRAKADEINNSNMSNADKIAAMRKEAFKSVDELQQSGKVKIPKL